jgi:hypothetical protein
MIVPRRSAAKPLKLRLSRRHGDGRNSRRAIVAGAVNRLQTKPGKTRRMIMVKAVLS